MKSTTKYSPREELEMALNAYLEGISIEEIIKRKDLYVSERLKSSAFALKVMLEKGYTTCINNEQVYRGGYKVESRISIENKEVYFYCNDSLLHVLKDEELTRYKTTFSLTLNLFYQWGEMLKSLEDMGFVRGINKITQLKLPVESLA